MSALITQQEIALARHCLSYALEHGASGVRITLSKSLLNLVGVLNGEVDKISRSTGRSMSTQRNTGSPMNWIITRMSPISPSTSSEEGQRWS